MKEPVSESLFHKLAGLHSASLSKRDPGTVLTAPFLLNICEGWF